jgi:hypothetical protein
LDHIVALELPLQLARASDEALECHTRTLSSPTASLAGQDKALGP